MFDQLFPEATEAALNAKLLRPVEPQPTGRFSTWGLISSAPKGVLAGTAQGIGSTADILGAFGQVLGATDARSGGMFSAQTDAEKTQTSKAVDQLLSNGPDYMSEVGRSFRSVAKDYMPDPVTSHWSEQAVANLFRIGSKAIASAATLGNIPGAVVAGAEEGFTMSSDLAEQGVDLATRTKVGAINAAVNAVGFALPAAGKTWAQTGALALVGGPVSFVAQNLATREILQRADYSKQADQYDPFDPVGLALSTIVPLGFGALAMRGAKAKGPMPDAPKVSDDVVDSARVSLLRENVDAKNPAPDNIAAADAHVNAYSKAIDQMSSGERVSVSDIAPEDGGRINSAIQMIRERIVNTARGVTDSMISSANEIKRFVSGQATDALDNKSTVMFSDVSQSAHDRILAETGIDVPVGSPHELRADVVRHSQNRHPDLTQDDWAALPWLAENFDRVTLLKSGKSDQGPRIAITATDPISGVAYVAEFRHGKKKGSRMGLVTFFRDHPNSINSYLETNGVKAAKEVTPDAPMLGNPPEVLTPKTSSGVDPILPRQAENSSQPVDAVPESPIDKVLRDLEVRNPTALDAEIPIEFDQSGKVTKTVSARQFLEDVQREADMDMKDAGLIEVAATCFLSSQ